MSAVDSDRRLAAVDALHDHHAVWNERLTSVWVHGSEAAATAAYALDHELAELGTAVVYERLPESDWIVRREPVQQRFDDYIDAIRADLALPHLRVLRANASDRLEQDSTQRTH
ncbi:hypothetical protein [Nocardia brasiliensis]|uniref:hypothetical protein n=1 Tax=Nocardia brasiliensis TaxID=37326 RepID=UPI0011DE5471|nr:hypothetical protein [Nocardia brasiliensis]